MTDTDSAALAFRAAIKTIAAAVPGSHHQIGPHGTLLALTGAKVPALNPILSPAAEPDADEIAELAEVAAWKAGGAPWSIRVRRDPDPKILKIAESYRLTTTATQPFMLRSLAGRVAERANNVTVRRLAGRDHQEFAAVLSAGFGVPADIISTVYTAEVLDSPAVTAYIAETNEGIAASAAVAILNDQHLAVGNVATLPEFRGGGYALAVTETILRDGLAGGAHTAYLHTPDEHVPFFERLGFATREHWTMLSAF